MGKNYTDLILKGLNVEGYNVEGLRPQGAGGKKVAVTISGNDAGHERDTEINSVQAHAPSVHKKRPQKMRP